MLFKIFCVCVAVTLATAATVPPEKCPNFPVTTNLNVEKYAEGKWYLLAKSEKEDWYNCTSFETKLTPEKLGTKHNYDKHGNKISFDYPFEVDAEKGEFTFPSLRINDEPARKLIHTDYEHFALCYCCKQKEDGSIKETVTLKVREADLPNKDSHLEAAKKILADAGSKLTELFPINRENCP